DDDGGAATSQRGPVDRRRGAIGIGMSGHDREALGEAAMRDRNPGAGGCGDGRADARNNARGYVGMSAHEQCSRAAPEDESVPALITYDLLSGAGMIDHDLVDGVLAGGSAAGDLGDVDDLRVRPGPRDGFGRAQAVR